MKLKIIKCLPPPCFGRPPKAISIIPRPVLLIYFKIKFFLCYPIVQADKDIFLKNYVKNHIFGIFVT